MRKPNIELLCDSHHGVYIPQIMIQRLLDAGWTKIPFDAVDVLKDIEHENYWDTWEEVLNNAEWKDQSSGQVFKLHHDGDLWAYCPDSCTPQEYFNLFGEFPEWYTAEEEV